MRPEVPKGRRPVVDFPPLGGLPARTLAIAQATIVAKKFHERGDLQTAAELFRLILDADSEFDEARMYYGIVLHQSGQSDEGVEWIKRAVASSPDIYEYLGHLGAIYDERRQAVEALACFEKANAIRQTPETCYNLGVVTLNLGRLEESETWLRRSIAMQPRHKSTSAYNNLACVLHKQGKLEEAIENYKIAYELAPEDSLIHSNYLYILNFGSQNNPAYIFNEHKQFGSLYEKLAQGQRAPIAARIKHKRIRIGYLSPDFRQHSVAHFIEPVLAEHDKSKFELFAYYHHLAEDELTKRIRASFDHWRNITRVSDADVVTQVRNDEIDIFVDLAGHAGLNRTTVFAHKPAPVQVTWLGYPNTTGLSTMDYRITDAFADPVGMTEAFHTEQLVRLPECFSCFKAPVQSPNVGPLPVLKNGGITFGSFNVFPKMTPLVLQTWSRILKALPSARLVLKYQGLESTSMRALIHGMFHELGVDKQRVDILGRDENISEHMARYNTIDIALDPFPYNGTTTTCDALWMGVPVITLAGNTHVSRVGVSQMSNLNLSELIAKDTDDYVFIATQLANDLPRLENLRAGLRQRMMQSPLMNVPRFTKHLEAAYEKMWAKYLQLHSGDE